MKYMKNFIFVAVLVAACSEYFISDPDYKVPGVPNPPEIDIPPQIDEITQSVKGKVDVLWVIDNSCSMREEQSTLITNFPHFISYFIDSGLDWHIGVTSTDMNPGEEPGTDGILNKIGGIRFIDEFTLNPIAVFQDLASLGVWGSGTERGLGAAFSAISVHDDCEHNKDFYRKDASLSIIVISDEQDHTQEPILPEFIDWLANLKQKPEDVTFSSIVCLRDFSLNGIPCSINPSIAPSVGSKYMSVTNAIGGVLWDIREDDWSQVLDQLGLQAAGLRTEFFLRDLPVPYTIDVSVNTEDNYVYTFVIDQDFTYDPIRNSITFLSYVPPQKATIYIKYVRLDSYQSPQPETGI